MNFDDPKIIFGIFSMILVVNIIIFSLKFNKIDSDPDASKLIKALAFTNMGIGVLMLIFGGIKRGKIRNIWFMHGLMYLSMGFILIYKIYWDKAQRPLMAYILILILPILIVFITTPILHGTSIMPFAAWSEKTLQAIQELQQKI